MNRLSRRAAPRLVRALVAVSLVAPLPLSASASADSPDTQEVVVLAVADTVIVAAAPCTPPGVCPTARKAYGNDLELTAGRYVHGGRETVAVPVVRFDVPSLPPGHVLDSAAVTVHTSGDQGEASVAPITTPWDEATASAAQPPQWQPSATIVELAPGTATVDVTALVRQWLAAPGSNHGFALPPASAAPFRASVSSRENGHRVCAAAPDDPPCAYRRDPALVPTLTVRSTLVSDTVSADVHLTAPPDARTVFGTEPLAATVSGVTPLRVEFLADGVVVASDDTAPYTADWDTSAMTDGQHFLAARAVGSSRPHRVSAPTAVTVDNALPSVERVVADHEAGRLTLDEFVRLGFYAGTNPSLLPVRYRAAVAATGESISVLAPFLARWDETSPELQAEITAYATMDRDAPPEAALATGAGIGSMSMPAAAPAGRCNDVSGRIFGVRLTCIHFTGHYEVFYELDTGDRVHGVPIDDEVDSFGANTPDGIPDYVQQLERTLEEAWETYHVTLGYQAVGDDTAVPVAVMNLRQDRLPFINPAGIALPIAGRPIVVANQDGQYSLARHESFHRFQYEYIATSDLGRSSTMWWMEATAEWAADKALRPGGAEPLEYARNIDAFLDSPHRELTRFELNGGTQYGAFLFAKWLEQRFDTRIIRQTWERLDDGDPARAIEAIDDVIEDRGRTLRGEVDAFTDANYRIARSYTDPDRFGWLGFLNDNERTEADDIADARPDSGRITLSPGETDDRSYDVEPGGARYIDLISTGGMTGTVTVKVRNRDFGASEFPMTYRLVGYSTHPDTCAPVRHIPLNDDRGELRVPLGGSCRIVTVVITNTDPLRNFVQVAEVEAHFEPDAAVISNGTVQIGVNAEGHLNVANGGTPSNGSNTTAVGLRLRSTNNDGLAPGCFCEGWGAADGATGVTGYANESTGGAVNLQRLSFTATATTARSVVAVGSTLRVTHDYRPSSSAFLYQAAVSITNTSANPVDLRYRRVMDWDAEPTAFSEYVTVTGAPLAIVKFTSNDGFATANPLGARSNLGVTGYFTDVGPTDHGALIDLGFGQLSPGATKSFTIFYGAAPDESRAVQALNDVGAEVHSLGQPSSSASTSGTPNTFMFGVRDGA